MQSQRAEYGSAKSPCAPGLALLGVDAKAAKSTLNLCCHLPLFPANFLHFSADTLRVEISTGARATRTLRLQRHCELAAPRGSPQKSTQLPARKQSVNTYPLCNVALIGARLDEPLRVRDFDVSTEDLKTSSCQIRSCRPIQAVDFAARTHRRAAPLPHRFRYRQHAARAA